MISWKAFWVAAGALLALAIAALTTRLASGLPYVWLLADLLTIGLAVGVTFLSAAVVDHAKMFKTSTTWQRLRVWIGTSIATWAYAAWTIAAIHLPAGGVVFATAVAALVLLAALVYGAARGLEWWLATSPGPAAPTAITGPLSPAGQVLDGREATMAEALTRAGYPWLRVDPAATVVLPPPPGKSTVSAGTVFSLAQPSYQTIATHQARMKRLKKINPEMQAAPVATSLAEDAAEQIAIALGEVTGKPVISDRVQLAGRPGAGSMALTVLNSDVMARVIPYADPVDAFGQLIMTVINEPQTIGIGVDGCACGLRLDQHGRIIGMSRYGKSALIHLVIAHLTRCKNAMVWISGRQKVYDLVAGWLDPYLGTGDRPPLDWVANGQTDTLRMMAAAMRVARYRQSLPMAKRKGLRRIVVIVDEFSYVAEDDATFINFAGQKVTGSAIAAMLSRGSASAGVYLLTASQRSTQDHSGSRGADVATNAGYAIMLPSKDHQELGRVTGDYKLPRPKHKGEFVLSADGEDPRSLKAPYIQSIDPDQDELVDVTISDVAEARRGLARNAGLTNDEGLAAAGAPYADRHLYVTDAMVAYLAADGDAELDAAAAKGDDVRGHSQEGYDAMMAALGTQEAAAEATARAPARGDRIVAILHAAPDGMTLQAITAALRADGDDAATPDRVSATLSRMVMRGQITRPAEGVYAAGAVVPAA